MSTLDRIGKTAQIRLGVGRRVQAARWALGVSSRARFAEIMNVSDGQLGNWESGYNFPRPEFLIRLAERYGVAECYILRGSLMGLTEDMKRRLENAERFLDQKRDRNP